MQFYNIINKMQNAQRQLFEQQILLLRLQIEEQNRRQAKLKQLVDTLTQKMQQQQQVYQQNLRLTHLNEKLLQGLQTANNRHNEAIKYCDMQISKLKLQLQDKSNEQERYQVQFQKRQLAYQQKIAMLQSIIQKKRYRVNDLETKLHDQSIIKLKQKQQNQNLSFSRNQKYEKLDKQSQRMSQIGSSVLRISNIDYESQNNMRVSNLSTISKKSKTSDFMKMDKTQMKVMMGALLKSKKQIQKAEIKCMEYMPNRTTLN